MFASAPIYLFFALLGIVVGYILSVALRKIYNDFKTLDKAEKEAREELEGLFGRTNMKSK